MKLFWKNRLASAEEMRELDRRTIEEFGLPGELLMEAAARGVFNYLEREYAHVDDALIFCGKGNNGGDGFAIGRLLLNRGAEVTAILLGKKKDVKGDAKLNLDRFLKSGGELLEVERESELDDLLERMSGSGLVVDAIFGTGLSSAVTGVAARAIALINAVSLECGMPVIAVDIPSGVNGSTGEVRGDAVRADATVTFGLAKVGHYTYPGAHYVGELEVVDIGIPSSFCEQIRTFAVSDETALSLIQPRPADSHKGGNGHAVIFAGSPGKTGAAALTGLAALRAGAGLVTLAVPASLNDIFEAKVTEVMTEPIPDEASRKFGKKSIAAAKKILAGKDAIALGPGIGMGDETDAFVKEILLAARVPLVLDADGLTSLSRQPGLLKKIKAPLILTPHPGEMSRLCGIKTANLQSDRLGLAKKFATQWGAIVALKGARTVIAHPDGSAFINLSGNSGMAAAGMGDALTGIIAGLLAQHYDPLDAAALGVYIHGKAGDLAAEKMGGVGIIASDLIRRIPLVRKWLFEQFFGQNE